MKSCARGAYSNVYSCKKKVKSTVTTIEKIIAVSSSLQHRRDHIYEDAKQYFLPADVTNFLKYCTHLIRQRVISVNVTGSYPESDFPPTQHILPRSVPDVNGHSEKGSL